MSDFTAKITAKLNNLSQVESQIKKLGNTEIKLSNVKIGDTAAFTRAIQSALNNMGLKVDTSKAFDFKGLTAKAQAAGNDINRILTNSFSSLNISGLQAKLTSTMNEFNKLGNVSSSLQANMRSLQAAFDTVNNANIADSDRVAAAQRFNQILSVTNTQISTQARLEREAAQTAARAEKERADALRQVAREQQTLTKSATLSNQIESWMQKNTKAAQQYGDQLRQLQQQLNNNTDAGKLTQVRDEFAKIKSEAQAAGLTTNTFATSLKNIALQTIGITSVAMAIRKVASEVKEAINTVVELDTALVDLQKTSSMTGSELSSYYYDANEIAKQLGRTTQEIIQTSADWSRLGYGSYEDATRMSKLAAQFASISPGMSIDDSTGTLVSVMKAFDVQTNEVLDGIMSKINIVGNNFALSNADLSEGLMNSSSAMAAANNTLEETIALITAGTEITQNASKVGNGLRTISMRIRGMDEETEQLDESLVNIKSDISELTNGKISIMEDADTYKSTYEILRDISYIWDDLTDKQQAGLLEKLFGKTRAQIGAAILQNFSAAEEAMSKMEDSAGNADAEMSIIMESLEYKLNALKETGTGIIQNLFPREDIGNAVEALTSILEVVDKITEKLGPGGTLAALAGAGGLVALIKNFGKQNCPLQAQACFA